MMSSFLFGLKAKTVSGPGKLSSPREGQGTVRRKRSGRRLYGAHVVEETSKDQPSADFSSVTLSLGSEEFFLTPDVRCKDMAHPSITVRKASPKPQAQQEEDKVLASTTVPKEATPISEPEVQLSHQISKNDLDELGYMHFQFDSLEKALARAHEHRRPVFCLQLDRSGVVDQGKEIFSHPLIVEAAESLFVTVHERDVVDVARKSCYTSSGKHCRSMLRFLDEFGSELVPTLASGWLTTAGVVNSMIGALEACPQPMPRYLQLLKEEEEGHIEVGPGGPRSKAHQRVFGMEDFVLGEVEFAGLNGVLATRSGYIDRQRVVEVTYDSRRLTFSCLVRFALQRNVGDVIFYHSNDERIAAQVEVERVQASSRAVEFSGSIQPGCDPKRALRRTPLRFVPLTGLQATRANRLVHFGRFNDAVHLLSPRQGLILMQVMKLKAQKTFHDVVEIPILPAWISVCELEHPKRTIETMKGSQVVQTGDYA